MALVVVTSVWAAGVASAASSDSDARRPPEHLRARLDENQPDEARHRPWRHPGRVGGPRSGPTDESPGGTSKSWTRPVWSTRR